MNAGDLVDTLRQLDVTLQVQIDQIHATGSTGQIPDQLDAEIRRTKSELISLLGGPVCVSGSLSPTNPPDRLLVFRFDHRLLVWIPGGDEEAFETACQGLDPKRFGVQPDNVHRHHEPTVPDMVRRLVVSGRCFFGPGLAPTMRLLSSIVGVRSRYIDLCEPVSAGGYPTKLTLLNTRFGLTHPFEEGKSVHRENLRRELVFKLRETRSLEEIYPHLVGCVEAGVVEASHRINDRGVKVDVRLVQQLISLAEDHLAAKLGRLTRLQSGHVEKSDLRKHDYVLRWLRERDLSLPNLRTTTLERLAEGIGQAPSQYHPDVEVVVEALITMNRNQLDALNALMQRVDADGRIRDAFHYFGCHTGRFSSSGAQLHNQPHARLPTETASRLLSVAGNKVLFSEELPADKGVSAAVSSLRRSCLVAAAGKLLCIADFHAVEARGLAWLADDERLLSSFRSGEDLYVRMASIIYGCPVEAVDGDRRNVGKLAVLACGFGMGGSKFEEYADKYGVDLRASNVSAESVVMTWRQANPLIAGGCVDGWRYVPGLWAEVEDAARRAILEGQQQISGKCCFIHDGHDLGIWLPSGRLLHYRNASFDSGNGELVDNQIWFDHPKNGRELTHGRKLVQNIVQGICRDILVECLLACECQGLPVVMHVHDEIVVEVATPDAHAGLLQLNEIMSKSPPWASDLPLNAAGYVSERYGYPNLFAS